MYTVGGQRILVVDAQVHVDRPGDQAMKEWSTSPPPDIKSPRGSAEGTEARKNAADANPLHAERVRSQQEKKSGRREVKGGD